MTYVICIYRQVAPSGMEFTGNRICGNITLCNRWRLKANPPHTQGCSASVSPAIQGLLLKHTPPHRHRGLTTGADWRLLYEPID